MLRTQRILVAFFGHTFKDRLISDICKGASAKSDMVISINVCGEYLLTILFHACA